MDIWETTNESIQAAKRSGVLTDADEGACSVLLSLAERLDDVRRRFPLARRCSVPI